MTPPNAIITVQKSASSDVAPLAGDPANLFASPEGQRPSFYPITPLSGVSLLELETIDSLSIQVGGNFGAKI